MAKQGQGKHRTVDISLEEPWFKKKRAKNRARTKIARKSKKINRRK